jgi:hypothetical protein
VKPSGHSVTRARLRRDAIRRQRITPIWKIEAALNAGDEKSGDAYRPCGRSS